MSTDGGTIGGAGYGPMTDEELRGSLISALEREGALKIRVAELEEGGGLQMVAKAKEQLGYLQLVHTAAALLVLCASMLLMFKSFGDLAALFRGEEQSIGQYFVTAAISAGLTLVFIANLASTFLHYSIGKTLTMPTRK